jgi:hypothetical protein
VHELGIFYLLLVECRSDKSIRRTGVAQQDSREGGCSWVNPWQTSYQSTEHERSLGWDSWEYHLGKTPEAGGDAYGGRSKRD